MLLHLVIFGMNQKIEVFIRPQMVEDHGKRFFISITILVLLLLKSIRMTRISYMLLPTKECEKFGVLMAVGQVAQSIKPLMEVVNGQSFQKGYLQEIKEELD